MASFVSGHNYPMKRKAVYYIANMSFGVKSI